MNYTVNSETPRTDQLDWTFSVMSSSHQLSPTRPLIQPGFLSHQVNNHFNKVNRSWTISWWVRTPGWMMGIEVHYHHPLSGEYFKWTFIAWITVMLVYGKSFPVRGDCRNDLHGWLWKEKLKVKIKTFIISFDEMNLNTNAFCSTGKGSKMLQPTRSGWTSV